MSDHTSFRAIQHFNQPSIIEGLEENLRDWCDWCMLGIGGWVNVSTGNYAGRFGGDFSTLHVVDDPSYTDNTVYQAIRKDWCWETGINYASPTGGTHNPVTPQIYFNNTAISTGTASHSHYINYPMGQVIFSTAQTGTIKASYSYRAVQVYTYDETDWTFEVNYDTSNPAITQWTQNLTSGDFSKSAATRLQLPAIVVEAVPEGTSSPYELGTLVAKNRQDILFHILSQDRFTRNNLADIFRLQKGKIIVLYDLYKVYSGGYLPLDERGMKVANPVIYPNIVNNSSLVFRQAEFIDVNITNIETKNPNLFWAVARCSLEVIY
jgi:hypothetical protein